jgi:hypothetical protein
MKIGFKLIAAAFVLLVGGSAVVVLVKTREPITTTVCELVAHPERFNGKIVQIRATLSVGYEISDFVDDHCEGVVLDGWSDSESQQPLEFAYINSEDDLQHPERLKWKPDPKVRPIKVQEDDGFRTLEKYVSQYYFDLPATPGKDPCGFHCRKFKVTGTFTGRFDYDDRRLRAFRNLSTGKITTWSGGFGHAGASSIQLVWQSVSDVVAVPIDRSFYDKKQ